MLQLNQVIDFDDCILKCAELLKNNLEVRKKLHEQYEYYLVDEFQDTNFAQLSFLRNIVNERDNICVVGDDDQSIYSWRGAMYETIERFESLFQKSHLIKLEQNYRCTKLILNAANSVIKNNVIRKDKTLWSDKFSDAPIILKPCRDETDEAQWIALKILALLGRGFRPSDIGILYRANALARPIEIALREHRIQYKVFGGQSFFERKEIKDFMAYLKLVADPSDRMAFWRVINTPHRGMGMKSCEVIDDIAQKQSLSPLKALKNSMDALPKKAVAPANEFIEFIESARKIEVKSPAAFGDLCRFIIQGTKIDKYFKEKAATISVGLKKAEMIRDLPNWLERSAENVREEKGQLDFHELMDALTLQQEDRNKDENGSDYVSLMSIHSAKGLEFPHVFLCGVEDDLLPHRNSVEEAHGISEERRLFYVAITRAKDQLFMTHTLSRSGITRQSESKKPSRFLDEIPQDIISCDGYFEKDIGESQENKRAQTKSRLSSLKDELRLNK